MPTVVSLRCCAPGLSLIKARCAFISLKGLALNAAPLPINPMDILLAQQQGFIIADASGVVGFVPLNPGQRDPSARRAKDTSDSFGE